MSPLLHWYAARGSGPVQRGKLTSARIRWNSLVTLPAELAACVALEATLPLACQTSPLAHAMLQTW